MAQKVTVALEDDLDGGPADETVRFGIAMRNARSTRQLAPFIEHVRQAGGGPCRGAGAASSRA